MSNIPFKGLIPYSEADAHLFFGRKNDTESIIDNLKVRRLTILYGESGVGKSSVLRAGVVHKLREETAEKKSMVVIFPPDPSASDEKNHLEISTLSWQDEPLTALKEQIEKDIKKTTSDIQSPKSELSFVETLLGWTEGTNDQKGCGELFIILDQFEQYFLYHPQENKKLKFDVEFARAVNHSELRVNFLISIREDELAKLDRFQELIPRLSDNYLRLEHLDRKSAREAISEPITIYNDNIKQDSPKQTIYLEPRLVNAVLDSISQYVPSRNGLAGIKKFKSQRKNRIEAPYLQLMMQRLWKEMRKADSSRLRRVHPSLASLNLRFAHSSKRSGVTKPEEHFLPSTGLQTI